MSRSIAIDLDGALGDTRGLWDAFIEDAARRFHTIAELDVAALPYDRGAAATELDRWSEHGIGDWRGALTRFAEDHAPVYLRPNAAASASLRALAGAGWSVGVYTDAPEELARVALAQLAATRRVTCLETGAGARSRLIEQLGTGTVIAETTESLSAALT
jgi:phosphoglycolate phosphatase-like HAD superfamily hydrolase